MTCRRRSSWAAAGSLRMSTCLMPAQFGASQPQLKTMRAESIKTDTCPVPGADGADALWVTDEEVPRADASIDDGLVGVPNQGGQFVAAQESPDVFHRIEFGAVGGQIEQGDVLRHAQALAALMPAGAVQQQDRMCTGR